MKVRLTSSWNLPPRRLGEASSFLAVPASKTNPSSSASPPTPEEAFFRNSYAQVATSVLQRPVSRKSCELKLKESDEENSHVHGVRFQAREWDLVRSKAQTAELSINSYIRAAVLGSDYQPPLHDGLRKLLLATNRELTAQGNNLNQIAKQLNMGRLSPAQATALLDSIRAPLVKALLKVKNILTQGMPEP